MRARQQFCNSAALRASTGRADRGLLNLDSPLPWEARAHLNDGVDCHRSRRVEEPAFLKRCFLYFVDRSSGLRPQSFGPPIVANTGFHAVAFVRVGLVLVALGANRLQIGDVVDSAAFGNRDDVVRDRRDSGTALCIT